MSKEVWRKIVAGKYKSAKGILTGYESKKIINKSYPGLIESSAGKARGVIYFDIDKEDLKNLDLFEGDEYKKIKVDVLILKNKNINCITYLLKKNIYIYYLMKNGLMNYS